MAFSLLREIAPAASRLLEGSGWQVVAAKRGQEFGNAVVELTSPGLELRVARDRGDMLLDVRSPSAATWHRLELVLEFALNEPQSASPVALVESLLSNLGPVTRIMSEGRLITELLEFEKRQADAARRGFFSS